MTDKLKTLKEIELEFNQLQDKDLSEDKKCEILIRLNEHKRIRQELIKWGKYLTVDVHKLAEKHGHTCGVYPDAECDVCTGHIKAHWIKQFLKE